MGLQLGRMWVAKTSQHTRGYRGGMPWTLVVMVSRVLDQDIRRLDDWRRNENLAWTYCGVRTGLVPGSRPMGSPVDRDFQDIHMLAMDRENWAIKQVTIIHTAAYMDLMRDTSE